MQFSSICEAVDCCLVGRLTSHVSTKIGYIGDKVLGGDLI